MKIIFERLKHAWNIFKNPNAYDNRYQDIGYGSSNSPTISYYSTMFERSMIFAVCNRIAIDVATYDIQHVRVDPLSKRYVETMKSGLNDCLTFEANIDQTGRTFIQDIVMSMFDEGYVAVVPTETDMNILKGDKDSYKIFSMRTAKILEWYPKHIKVDIYNDKTGLREWLVLPKSRVAIIENPLYAVMNEPNGTMKRLMKKLILLDAVDTQSSSGKLDIIIQLPYVVKSELRQKQAEERRKAIENQLTGSKYGIAYTDATERITQLNRPSENNLLAQVTYLTNMLYNQLGISEAVFNGTADHAAMLNYYDRTVEPIATALMDEFKRKFLTKTARSQGQTIMGFRDVFKLIPANEIAEMADSLTRNEILSSNEVRSILGLTSSSDPAADELRNKNMPIDPSMQDPSMQDPSMQDPSMQDPSMQDPSMQDPSMQDPSMQDPLAWPSSSPTSQPVQESQMISVVEVDQMMDEQAQNYERAIDEILTEIEKVVDALPNTEEKKQLTEVLQNENIEDKT